MTRQASINMILYTVGPLPLCPRHLLVFRFEKSWYTWCQKRIYAIFELTQAESENRVVEIIILLGQRDSDVYSFDVCLTLDLHYSAA